MIELMEWTANRTPLEMFLIGLATTLAVGIVVLVTAMNGRR